MRPCLSCLGRACTSRGGRTPKLAPPDFGIALLVACVGAAIVIGVSFSMQNYNQASAEARVGDMARDLTERMRLVFEPSVSVLRAAAATCAEIDVNLTSWGRRGAAMFKVLAASRQRRARRDGGARDVRVRVVVAAR